MKVRLFYKIFLTFLVVALLPLVYGSFWFCRTLDSFLTSAIHNNAELSLKKSALLIESSIQHYDEVFNKSVKTISVGGNNRQVLEWLYHTHPDIEKLVISDLDGKILHAIARYEHLLQGTQLTDCNPRSLHKTRINYGRFNNEPRLCLRYPIINLQTGKQFGALFVKINVTSLFQTLLSDSSSSRYQYLVEDNHRVIFHPDFNLVLQGIRAEKIPVIQQLHNGVALPQAVYTNFNGTEVVGTARKINGAPLYLVEEIDHAEARQLLNAFLRQALLLTLSGSGFVLLMSLIFSRSLSRPISSLTEAMTRIAAGELNTTISFSKRLFPDELNQMEAHFKQMIIAIKRDRRQRDNARKSEQKALHQLSRAQKLEAIGLLAGSVAHDLNNILSGVTGYPQLILRKLPPESPLRPQLEAIQKSGYRAAAVVADLLTVARGVAAELRTEDLNVIVSDYCSSPEYTTLLESHPKIACHYELTSQILPIKCSQVHVKKSVMNLVTNAFEAIGEKGEISITSSLRSIAEEAPVAGLKPGGYAVLQVKDSGSGISEQDLEHIFEPFYTKKSFGFSGSGLGLHIVWNTMQEHHGRVTVTSDSHGTTFSLFFPLVDQQPGPAAQEEVTPEISYGHGKKILIVDDDEQQRVLSGMMLKELGYETYSVNSGEDALIFLTEHSVDLILLDMIMDPGINGQETYRQILEIHPGQRAVIASGYADTEEVKLTLAAGAGAFIGKPYTLENLAEAVRQAFA